MKKPWRQVAIAFLAVTLLTGIAQASEQNNNGNNDLASALKFAVTFHPSVKSKVAELNSLGFKLGEAEAARLPSISMTTQTMSNDSNHGLMRAQQPIWSFGKIEGNISVAERQIDVGKLEILQVRRQLLEDTAAAYVTHWGAKQRLIIAENNVTEHDRLYQMILRRQQGGVASEADVHLALSRLIQARAQWAQLQGAVETARNELNALTQTPISADTPVDSVLAEVPILDVLLAVAYDREARVQVRLAELEVVRKEADLRKAERMPTLYARLDHNVTKTSDYSSENRFGIVFEGSLDGMGIIGKKRAEAAAAQIVVAQENLADTRNEVRRRLTTLMTEREIQQQVGLSYELSTEALEETLKSFLRQFDAGRKSWIDVLNFQRELSDTRLQLEQTRTTWREVSLRIAAINGQLDSVAEVKP